MGTIGDKEELYRRLMQSRRLEQQADDHTKGRIRALVVELETQIAAAEARDADSPD